jgi:hypothetical protein
LPQPATSAVEVSRIAAILSLLLVINFLLSLGPA